LTGSTVQWLHC